MTGDELIEQTRVLLMDTAKPYLWTDDTILRYLREAEKLFCRRTHVLMDSLPVTTEADTPSYEVDSRVCKVKGAALDGMQLSTLLAEAIYIHYDVSRGEPRAYALSLNDKQITFYPVPDAAYDIDLLCAVLPEKAVDFTTETEIPDEYQYVLCDYAAYRCLHINDVDGNNIGTSQKFEQRWNEGILEAKRMSYLYRTPDRVAMQSWTGGK